LNEVIDLLAKSASILPARERGNCRIWFKWEGKPVFLSSGSRKPKEAREALRAKIGEWYAKLPKSAPPTPSLPVSSMALEIERYFKLEHEHSREGTISEARYNLKELGEVLGWPDTPALTKALYRERYPALRDAVVSKTWANKLGEHRRFARFLVREEVLLRDFTEGVKRPKRSTFGKREEIYREEWFQPIWESLELHWREVWEDHWYTGMDTADLWQFDPQKHLVPIGAGLKIWKQRAKESEIIDQPLPSQIKERWAKARESGARFLHPSGQRYASPKSWGNQIRKALHAAQKRHGLPLLDLKTTRHTFTTRHLLRMIRGEKNAPTVEEIQRWLGHAKGSTEIHRTYAKILSNPHLMD
jgi:hypothetical protein